MGNSVEPSYYYVVEPYKNVVHFAHLSGWGC